MQPNPTKQTAEEINRKMYAPPFDGRWSRFLCPVRLDAIRRLQLPFLADDLDIYLAIMADAQNQIVRLDNKLAALAALPDGGGGGK